MISQKKNNFSPAYFLVPLLTACSDHGYDDATGELVDLKSPPSWGAVICLVFMVWYFTRIIYKDKNRKD